MLLSLEMSSGEATVCFNIGPAERRKRSVFGSVALGAALIALGAMSIGDVPRLWRIALFVPVWLGALGILQARAGTCVALARRGTRNLDRREEPAPDAELGPVRERARQLHLQSLLVASLVTGLLVWLG
jgi:hypothetical protein